MRNMTTPCYKNIPTKELETMATKNLIELMRYYDHNYNDSFYDCYWGNCQCKKECVELRKRMSMRIYEELENSGDDWENISDEELLSYSSQNTPNEKVRYRLFEMMVKGDLPKEFVVHLWW